PTPLSNVRPWGPGMLLSTEHPSLSASYVTGVFCAEQHARWFGEGGGDSEGGWYFGVGGWLGWWGGFEVGGAVVGVGGWLSARFASRGRVAGRIGDAGS